MNSSFSFSKNTVGFLIDGVLNEERLKEVHAEILEKIKRYGKINLYLEDNGIERFTLPAIAKEIAFKIKHTEHLNRVALVSNAKWVKACAAIEDLFLPTKIKHFTTEERMNAMSWIAQH